MESLICQQALEWLSSGCGLFVMSDPPAVPEIDKEVRDLARKTFEDPQTAGRASPASVSATGFVGSMFLQT